MQVESPSDSTQRAVGVTSISIGVDCKLDLQVMCGSTAGHIHWEWSKIKGLIKGLWLSYHSQFISVFNDIIVPQE